MTIGTILSSIMFLALLTLLLDIIFDWEFDITSEKELLLWYNSKNSRKHIRIWPLYYHL